MDIAIDSTNYIIISLYHTIITGYNIEASFNVAFFYDCPLSTFERHVVRSKARQGRERLRNTYCQVTELHPTY